MIYECENLNNRKDIIVSLTSYPARIQNLHKVIKTLLIQNLRPNKIVLWLADSEFNNKEMDLPPNLLELCQYGLEIRWCEDIKSHKKYYYAIREFPESIIITVDDDIYYSPRTVELLYESYLKFPNAVSCLCANKIVGNKEKLDYNKWILNYKDCINVPVMDLMAVGFAGVLYPPHCLPENAFNIRDIRDLCLYQDDIWLKFMELSNNIPTVLVGNEGFTSRQMENSQEMALYKTINREGNNIALQKLCNKFASETGEKDYIINKIFAENTVASYLEKLNANNQVKTEEVKRTIRSNKLIIYGAGMGALATIECLRYHMPDIKPYGFAVTMRENNPDYIFDIPVYVISDLRNIGKECVVIVSTAEKYHEDINKILIQLGFDNIFFVKDKVMGEYMNGTKCSEKAREDFLLSFRGTN